MMTMRMIDCRLMPRGRRRFFSRSDGGGGGGGIRWICWVGDASAGDGGRAILWVGPMSAGRYRPRSCSPGGCGGLGGGGLRHAGPGGAAPLPRQSGCPGCCGGITCAILPEVGVLRGVGPRRPTAALRRTSIEMRVAEVDAAVAGVEHGG